MHSVGKVVQKVRINCTLPYGTAVKASTLHAFVVSKGALHWAYVWDSDWACWYISCSTLNLPGSVWTLSVFGRKKGILTPLPNPNVKLIFEKKPWSTKKITHLFPMKETLERNSRCTFGHRKSQSFAQTQIKTLGWSTKCWDRCCVGKLDPMISQ